ncbi:uncharacterized protein LOC112045152 [Bicyclus anynana]|uniref:Uncharacterized protein LOC112045152 n=1 Tax=Bicyclus anynana TaxID=110368 RepID=A0ABM3LXV3_BICAN|nr:uncharacterized protein LOC112045152 [Bicyclus anynana]
MASVPPGTIRSYNVQMQNESPFAFTVLNLTNTITNLLLGAVAIMAFIYANLLMSSPKSFVVSQHIYLCVFGYIILMVQGIHSMNINTGWARAFSCNNKRTVHYALQVIGSILGIAGCLRMVSLRWL